VLVSGVFPSYLYFL